MKLLKLCRMILLWGMDVVDVDGGSGMMDRFGDMLYFIWPEES